MPGIEEQVYADLAAAVCDVRAVTAGDGASELFTAVHGTYRIDISNLQNELDALITAIYRGDNSDAYAAAVALISAAASPGISAGFRVAVTAATVLVSRLEAVAGPDEVTAALTELAQTLRRSSTSP
jgi:hypothetical protein